MTRHLDDAALLAHLDARDPDPREPGIGEHLDSCPACAHRLDRLRARSDRLASWFAEDAALPLPEAGPLARRGEGGGSRRSRWAAAAGVVLALGIVTYGSVQAWIAETRRPEAEPTAAAAPPAWGAEVAFDVGPGDFVVHATGGAEGSLVVVSVEEVIRGRVSWEGSGGDPGITLREGRVDLDAATGGGRRVTLRVALPAGVGRVRVLLGETEVEPRWVPHADSVPRRWSVPLGPR